LSGVKNTAGTTLTKLKDDIQSQVANLYKQSVDESMAKVAINKELWGENMMPIKTAIKQVNADRLKLGQPTIDLSGESLDMPSVQAAYQKLRELSVKNIDNRNLNKGYAKAAEFLESQAPPQFKQANNLRFKLEQDLMKPYEGSLLNQVSLSKSEAQALNKIFTSNPTEEQVKRASKLAESLPDDTRVSLARAQLQRAINSSYSAKGELDISKVVKTLAGNKGSSKIMQSFSKGTPLHKLFDGDTSRILGAQMPGKIAVEGSDMFDARSGIINTLYKFLTREEAGITRGAKMSAQGSKGFNELIKSAENLFSITRGTALGGVSGASGVKGSSPDRRAKNKENK
jgi:hypothetical protein